MENRQNAATEYPVTTFEIYLTHKFQHDLKNKREELQQAFMNTKKDTIANADNERQKQLNPKEKPKTTA